MTIDPKKTFKNVSSHLSTFLLNKTLAFVEMGFTAHGREDTHPIAVWLL